MFHLPSVNDSLWTINRAFLDWSSLRGKMIILCQFRILLLVMLEHYYRKVISCTVLLCNGHLSLHIQRWYWSCFSQLPLLQNFSLSSYSFVIVHYFKICLNCSCMLITLPIWRFVSFSSRTSFRKFSFLESLLFDSVSWAATNSSVCVKYLICLHYLPGWLHSFYQISLRLFVLGCGFN